MSIALAALIIALASLMWNVVSTAYSWRFSKPAIKIVEGWERSQHQNWFVVDVQNRGGSSIAVNEIDVLWDFERERLSKVPGKLRWARDFSGAGSGIPKAGVNDPEAGPDFPYTIQPYHAQKWRFGRSDLLRNWKNTPKRPKKFLVVVYLATGEPVTKEISPVVMGDDDDDGELEPPE
jgi:hypothetical protein